MEVICIACEEGSRQSAGLASAGGARPPPRTYGRQAGARMLDIMAGVVGGGPCNQAIGAQGAGSSG
eukprot:6810490-Pyramimonas_sp.AAC.1